MTPKSPTANGTSERDAEFTALQTAFDEYISSSRELEEELDAELVKMQEKLAESSASNMALVAQLENVAPQLTTLEKALSDTKMQLEDERKARRQAEWAQEEAEDKARQVEGSLIQAREESEDALQELAFCESTLEDVRLELEVERERHRVELEELRTALPPPPAADSNFQEDEGQEIIFQPPSGTEIAKEEEEMDRREQVDSAVDEADSEKDEYIKRLEDELELVTEQLIDLEEKTSILESKLSDSENARLEAEKNYMEMEQTVKEKEEANQSLSEAKNNDTIIKLKEELHVQVEKEQQLREEMELTQEELTLTIEELRKAEENYRDISTELEVKDGEHKEAIGNLQEKVDKVTAEVNSRNLHIESLQKTLESSVGENVALREEVANLETALQNSKNDHEATSEEMETLKASFDDAKSEAEAGAVEAMQKKLVEDHQRELSFLQTELEAQKEAHQALKRTLEEAEAAATLANEELTQMKSNTSKDEALSILQEQLSKSRKDLSRKTREANEMQEAMEKQLATAEKTMEKLTAELVEVKKQMEEQARALEAKKSSHSKILASPPPRAPTTNRSTSLRKLRSSSLRKISKLSDGDEERPESEFSRSHARSRRLEVISQRRRARSSSPTTMDRMAETVTHSTTKTKALQDQNSSLKDQNRMREVHVKRLEDDLKSVQSQLFGRGGDTPVVHNTSKAVVTAPHVPVIDETDIRDIGIVKVDEVLESRDPKRIAEELRSLAKKSAAQREYNSQLLSKILKLQGNIQVCCRIRPLKVTEVQNGMKAAFEDLGETEVGCFDARTKKWKSFNFDKVWGPESSQQSVFADVEPLALSVVDGYNTCIFAYGQTGSGKTYTMEGIAEQGQYGISYRTINKIFNLLNYRAQQHAAAVPAGNSREDEETRERFTFSLEVGMLEIYNDEVYDLLAATASAQNGGQRNPSLDIRRNKDGVVEVPGLTKEPVQSLDDVMSLLKRGNGNRATASTELNEHSSRSHMVLLVDVTSGMDGQAANKGTLYLVDLAGSERVRKSQVEGEQLKEAGHINKSLSALGNVMEALDRKASHVPYRDSKLTYLLQNSLGGNSRTMMVLAVCPMDVSYDESVYALQFATRVRRIQIGTAQRNITSKNLEETVKALTADMKMLAKAKEKSEQQLSSLKRDNTRIQERLAKASEARAASNSETRTLAALKKNNTEMMARWQKEKSLREDSTKALDKAKTELQQVQQRLAKTMKERDTLTTKMNEKEKALMEMKADLRRAKDASSAANIRARTAQIMRGGTSAQASPASQVQPRKTASTGGIVKPSPSRLMTTSNNSDTGSADKTNASPENVDDIRSQILELLQEHDKAKASRIDIMMETFKGKEALLLAKMKERYQNGSVSKLPQVPVSRTRSRPAATFQQRQEEALARHKKRMGDLRAKKTENN